MLRLKYGAPGVSLSFALLLFLPTGFCQSRGKRNTRKTNPPAVHRTLLWSDEFNGPDASLPDSAKWTIVEDGSGFGNDEMETYTKRLSNLHQEQGNLVLTARKEFFTGPDGQARSYTSGRIESRNHFSAKYGRIEARIRLPQGKGIWPAFWLLGNDVATTGWPACGEIDIMENIGSEPSMVHGSLQGPGYSGAKPISSAYTLPNNARFSDDFHIFAVEWVPQEIRFYVDDHLYATQTAASLSTGKQWVFNHPFYIVLNVAVGGWWPRNPDTATPFPASMVVDYVRVYRLPTPGDQPSASR